MAATSNDYRSLLGAGFWLAVSAAVLAAGYGLTADSSIALALAGQLVLLAAANWVAGDLHRKRDRTDGQADAVQEPSSSEVPARRSSTGSLRKAIQTERLVLAGTAALVGALALFQLLLQRLGSAATEGGSTSFGAVCLAVAFLWLVLARVFHAIPRNDLPEAEPLGVAFRDAQWVSLVAGGGLVLGTLFHPPLVLWTSRILLVWVGAECMETLARQVVPILLSLESDGAPVAPLQLLLREVVFARGNPAGNLLQALEARYAVGVRSSWAIRFVKRTALPLLTLLAFLSWGATSMVIVNLGQLGVRESFGRVGGEPLQPGLHFKLPWPCGQVRTFAVKPVHQVPIGFVAEEQPTNQKGPRALLWTRGHAKEEFALVLGGGTEFVVINALLYFKIAEDPSGFLDYVYGQANPEEALGALAYRALMEETRGRTLDEVLSADRSAFARRLVDSVRGQARAARLGLEVVDLALINLHPPIEAAGSYLDVINARLDARRQVTEAEGKKQVALLAAQTAGTTAIATARVGSCRRVAEASSQVAEFLMVAQASTIAREIYRLRLWVEALEKALTNQRLILVDHSLLSEGGELLLDTRRAGPTPLPSLELTPPAAPPGAKKRD